MAQLSNIGTKDDSSDGAEVISSRHSKILPVQDRKEVKFIKTLVENTDFGTQNSESQMIGFKKPTVKLESDTKLIISNLAENDKKQKPGKRKKKDTTQT